MSAILGPRGSANQVVDLGWKTRKPPGSTVASRPRSSKNVFLNDADLNLQEEVARCGKYMVIQYSEQLAPLVDGTQYGGTAHL